MEASAISVTTLNLPNIAQQGLHCSQISKEAKKGMKRRWLMLNYI